ncbi:MAG: hypothetical protein IIX64_04110, partial [Bacteroidales bacterium]|nr:hypothetical protein [Bacteroidales bacterium]
MKTNLFKILLIFLFAFSCANAWAQFYQTGDDPGGLKWRYIESASYKVIYPEGCDSLAKAYAQSLERYKKDVGRSAGVEPGEWQGGRTPVILHTQSPISNGVVVWAPKRMELYTNPPAYDPDPLPWMDNLAIHESRHVSQMQSGHRGVHKIIGHIVGEMWQGACAGIYFRDDYMEGDAVISETALSRSGRGRTADFLNYYMMSFDQGIWRDFNHWYIGSERHAFPDHYALGYMLYGGLRVFYDAPLVSKMRIESVSKRPLGIFTNKDRIFQKITGKKAEEVFPDIAKKTYELWRDNAEQRKPYIPSHRITPKGWFHTDYTDNMVLGDDIYSRKENLSRTPYLVRVDSSGKEHFIRHFAQNAGMLYHSPRHEHIFWSESVADERWGQAGYSIIRSLNLKTGQKQDLTRNTHYYNPCPSPNELHIALTEHLVKGGTALTVISAESGEVEYRFSVPDSLQIVECAWLENTIFATGISSNGFGIYHLSIDDEEDDEEDERSHEGRELDTDWECLLAPQPVKIKNFGSWKDHLCFTCDRNGNNEFYHFYPSEGELYQITSTRYGACDFQYSEDGKKLYYSLETLDGKMLAYTPTDSLLHKKVDFTERYHYPIADKLSRQEEALKKACEGDCSTLKKTSDNKEDIELSQPKRYSKLGNLFHFHSWAPFYANIDNILNMSYDHYFDMIGLGVMGLSQNELGTAVLQGGYCAHPDPDLPSQWRHAGHLKFTYSGLYPVFELEFDINDRAAREIQFSAFAEKTYMSQYQGLMGSFQQNTLLNNKPYMKGRIHMYIPFRHTRSGFTLGVIPSISYSISNDSFNPNYPIYLRSGNIHPAPYDKGRFKMLGSGKINQTLSANLRSYWVMSVAESAFFPRWGIGGEIGGVLNFWYPTVCPVGYAYLYG